MTNRAAYLFVALTVSVSLSNANTFEQGESAFYDKDYEKAAAIWQPLAKQNDIASLLALARLYSIGLGVEKKPTKAFELYKQAAQLGSAQAQNLLGILYATGIGVARDPITARTWYLKAAQQAYAEAIYNFGVSYFRGEGVTTDYVQAHAWIHVSVIMGHKPGQHYRDQIAEVLSKEKLRQSKKISDRLLNQIKTKAELSIQ